MSKHTRFKVSHVSYPDTSSLFCSDESFVQQCFAHECDINNILRNFERTGMLPDSRGQAQYLDVSELTDYQSALNSVLYAQEAFDSLPAKVRERFANDPALLVDFVLDSNNRDECERLGLIERKSSSDASSVAEKSQADSSAASADAVS